MGLRPAGRDNPAPSLYRFAAIFGCTARLMAVDRFACGSRCWVDGPSTASFVPDWPLPYTKGQPLPAIFHDGKAVLVGAYETLFNGRGKFGVRGSGQQVVKLGLQSPSERWLTTRTLCDQRPLRAPVRSA